jgi:hypothetical protein
MLNPVYQAEKFIFSSYAWSDANTLIFSYETVTADGVKEKFQEKVNYQEYGGFMPLSVYPVEQQRPFLISLHLMLGISYWKMSCPKHIEIAPEAGYTLTKEQAAFWNTLYTKGLGEFFYKNSIDYRGLVSFPFAEPSTTTLKPVAWETREDQAVVPIGGGKDSIVTALQLKEELGNGVYLFALNARPLQRKVMEILRLVEYQAIRVLDPKMLERSSRNEVYTGHVPMTAIYTFFALIGAAVSGTARVAISSEKSANYGNVEYLGEMINHQWSKSEEFEQLLAAYLRDSVTPNISVYSPLRNLTELQVVEKFVQHPEFFPVFSSCNKNFAIAGSKNAEGSLWCGECPKCAFMFVLLAAYLPKQKVIEIFGKNLFADETLLPLYQELLGKKNFKPFECVGTPEETEEAFAHVRAKGEFTQDAVMLSL